MKLHRNSNVPSSARKYCDVSAWFCNSEAWSSAEHQNGLLLHLGLALHEQDVAAAVSKSIRLLTNFLQLSHENQSLDLH